MSTIYKNIRWLCKQNNVAISEIEKPKQAGIISRYEISRYERRGAILELPLWIFVKVSRACGVTIDDIVEKNISVEQELSEVMREIERLKERERILQAERAQK